ESDGSVVQYKPEIGVILNIDKDHKEIDSLMEMFSVFRDNSKKIIVNHSHLLASQLSRDAKIDFSTDSSMPAGYTGGQFRQDGFSISFAINEIPFTIGQLGKHNMENAVAAVAAANQAGVDLVTCSVALKQYAGIYRRHQLLGTKNGIILIDDYAHNPVKCAAAIVACQPLASKVIAWFQPHGYGPTRFLKNDFVKEIAHALRPVDEIWMSEIFYAGGTTTKDISAADLINEIRAKGKNAFFVANRDHLVDNLRSHLTEDCVLLLMGARDPSLEAFAGSVWEAI
ncbi:MAG TPA: Mur ligase family protein, partial [Chitinophagaceae bacterium]|nr:Mur ligase family protein [Chitinophagaceae bacterium]